VLRGKAGSMRIESWGEGKGESRGFMSNRLAGIELAGRTGRRYARKFYMSISDSWGKAGDLAKLRKSNVA